MLHVPLTITLFNCIFFLFYKDTIDIDKEIKKIKKNSPYFVILESVARLTFIIVVERNSFITTNDYSSALIYLFAAYYVFNIQYPQLAYPVLIFIQRYILNLEDSQAIPQSIRQAVTVMKRFEA